MSDLVLYNSSMTSVTMIPNRFIDACMPGANGEFVKVYLYFLRHCASTHAASPAAGLTLERAADDLFLTEKDVARALRYWEQKQLLRLTWEDDILRGIEIVFADSADPQPEPASDEGPDASAYSILPPVFFENKPSVLKKASAVIRSLPAGDDEIFFIVEGLLGRPLSRTETEKVQWFRDGLGFSDDLIELLFEECVSGGHTGFRYIEAKALGWSKDGIRTREQAKAVSGSFNKRTWSVMKAFGLGSRMPAPEEAAYIRKWSVEYGFSTELTEEACRRTIAAISQPSFKYADSILTRWHEQHAVTMEDVRRLDAEYAAQKDSLPKSTAARTETAGWDAARTGAARTDAPRRRSSNRFNDFSQRSYDYEEMERAVRERMLRRAAHGPAGTVPDPEKRTGGVDLSEETGGADPSEGSPDTEALSGGTVSAKGV